MKELYEKVKRLEEKLEPLIYDYCIGSLYFKKLVWHLASVIMGQDFNFADMEGLVLLPESKVLLNNDNLSSVSDKVEGTFDDAHDLAPGYMLESGHVIMGKFHGEHWGMVNVPDSNLFSGDMDFNYFDDFFEELGDDYTVTDQNLSDWKSQLYWLLSDFFPEIDVELLTEVLLEKHEDLFFETIEEGQKLYKTDFECNAVEKACLLLRFKWQEDEHMRKCILCGLKSYDTYGEVFSDMSDEEILSCYDSLCHQPLMVNAWDITYTPSIPGYALFFSTSHMVLKKISENELRELPDKLRKDIMQYQDAIKEHGILFPFIHNEELSYYEGEKYIAGACSSFTEYACTYDLEVETNLSLPSLSDLVLIRWADALYNEYMTYKGQENKIAA